MTFVWKWIGVSMLMVSLAASAASLDRFKPGAKAWPDTDGVHINAHGGGILHDEGVYYWFGEHKNSGPKGNAAQVGVRCYSSTDLYNWKNEGVALKVSDDDTSEIVRGCIIERPKVIYNAKTQKFVMWFHLELKDQGYNAARTGVATSDRVTGPYTYLRSYRPNPGKRPINPDLDGDLTWLKRDFKDGQMARDMTLFVDDDGTAYHIHASEENRTLHICELTEDYTGFTGTYSRVFPGAHHEAPAVCKHEGRYYMISSGCTGWAPNAARSAVAVDILGPWTPLGNPCRGSNPQNGMGPEKTFGGQSTHILPVIGKDGAFIALFDIWTPKNPIDGHYIWLPITFRDGKIVIEWVNEWDLSVWD